MATSIERINSKISFYKHTGDIKNDVETSIDDFLSDILTGKYQDLVLAIRVEKDKDKRSSLKKKTLPCVTISGSFSARNDASLRAHSGFLAIDLDNLNEQVQAVKAILTQDPYVYAAFDSVSGQGLCLLVKIEGERHLDAFEAFSAYLYNNYQVIVDPSGKNISRLRYISYDPHLYSTDKPIVFKKYLPKVKPKPINRVVFVKTEFDAIINEFAYRHINICEDYRDWVSVGYAIASKFGLDGADYFHTLSSQSSKYDQTNTDNLYKAICKTESEAKSSKATIATIYYHARINNIQTYSTFTQDIIKTTTTLKKSGLGAEAIAKNIEEFEGMVREETIDIITQAIDNKIEIEESGSIVEEVERWLQYNTKLRRNEITRRIENFGMVQEKIGFNSMFVEAKKVIDKLDYQLFERIILSNKTPDYHPFLEWFSSYDGREPTGVIDKLSETIKTSNEEYSKLFIKKWLVGMISAMHGHHSPLMLILAGEKQGTGKTEWFRRLLPKDLEDRYFGECKFDRGKDDEITMCEKILLLDDELSGKTKAEIKKMKSLTSAQYFYLREPYGTNNIKRMRVAVLAGTTNDLNLLNDPTGNRRFLPIEVQEIDKELYNSIDKVDLILEAYNLYKSDFEWRLSDQDIKYLNSNTEQFNIYESEYELIQAFLTKPTEDTSSFQISYMIGVEVKAYLEVKSNQKINKKKMEEELKKIGFEKKSKKINGYSTPRYAIVKNENLNGSPDDIPF